MNLLQQLKKVTGVPYGTEEKDPHECVTEREPYYDYMMRRSREEDAKLKAQEDLEKKLEIIELEKRITKLEVDMAHIQAERTYNGGY